MTPQKEIILIVEDNQEVSNILQTIIEMNTNFQTIKASNGAEALKLLEEMAQSAHSAAQPKAYLATLILSDVLMPVMDGITLARTLKSSSTYRHIPIIMLSSSLPSLPDDLEIAYFIAKPFKVARLMTAINQTLAAAGKK